MNKSARIFVAGHRGLVGSAIVRCLEKRGFNRLIVRSHAELDLTDQVSTREFFRKEKPELVILAAARVGGINANSTLPAEFMDVNIAIQTNVIQESYRSNVEKLLFFGSSCIYPRDCLQPIREDYLLTGPLELTNRSYALAKIAGIEMCWAYNRQYGTRYLAVMPANMYGPNDNYDLENSHVLPALIRRIHEAKDSGEKSFQAWGTGEAWREFLYSDDLAEACFSLLTTPESHLDDLMRNDQPPLINVGSGEELRVRDAVRAIVKVVGFKGKVNWDVTKPDGTPRKLLDSTMMERFGWQPRVSLFDGLRLAYEDFLKRYS